jgi:CP family cyanate transporter-like MFS transporter
VTTASRSLWAGRGLALLGIVLVALNVRTAAVTVSPIAAQIGVDIPLDPVALGVIGMLPPVAFALSGVFAPFVARRLGLEATLALACAAMATGTVLRSVVSDFPLFFVGGLLALVGMGFGNILLPPAVKKYFPDRIGPVTAVYVTLVSVSAAVPPLFAVPVEQAAGWRVSIGQWAVLALLALVPWVVLWLRRLLAERRHRAALAALDDPVEEAEPAIVGRLWHSPTAWAIALVCGTSSLNFYSIVAWLPDLLIFYGVDQAGAASMLSLYALVGVPFALIVPTLAARMRNVGPLVFLGAACFAAGSVGLILAPQAYVLWVVVAASGTLIFPLALTLINLRTRSHEASTALSGFVQGIGYGFAAIGPLAIGVARELSGGWTVPLLLLAGSGVLVLAAGTVLARGRFVEDEGVRAT